MIKTGRDGKTVGENALTAYGVRTISMRLLLITNLYPPQELGGYGRCMADFAWGLQKRGHILQVISSDAPYLGPSSAGPSQEPVDRRLQLKGSFEGGVHQLQEPAARAAVDAHNRALLSHWLSQEAWDGILLGNLDLLGTEPLAPLLASNLPVLHHIGFVTPPYPPEQMPPKSSGYRVLAASVAVRQCLNNAGITVDDEAVIYPGARVDLFGEARLRRPLPPTPNGTTGRPLRVCFAGLQMGSKGPHTLLEALLQLKQKGIAVHVMLAGGTFQADYAQQLRQFCTNHQLNGQVDFLPQLNREQLARFFLLNHACVFPSLHPEAFGIVAAEAMASGLALVSTGVGGASEVFEDEISGLHYPAGNSTALAEQLERLAFDTALLSRLQRAGEDRVRCHFSVDASVDRLEKLLNS